MVLNGGGGISQSRFHHQCRPNLDGDITGIFAGNWITAWQKATQLVDKIFGVTIHEQADIVIASAGGYPKDINLYQSQKTIDNAVYAMKPGGIAIILVTQEKSIIA